MDQIDKSGYPLTSLIGFKKISKTLVLDLKKNSLISNMQGNEGAFEGWSLCIIANNPADYNKIRIVWTPLVINDLSYAERGHYYRFLFRAYMFKKNYPSLVEIQPAIETDFDPNECKLWVLNYPKNDSAEPEKKDEGSEANIEIALLKIMNGHFDYCDHQLPVGLFLNEIKKINARSSTGKSQIDLWSVKDNILNIYELKNDINEEVGIISELMFYTNVMENFRRHVFNYPLSFTQERVFYRHSKELYSDIINNKISAVKGTFLANKLHPRITDSVIDLLNTNIAGIHYSKLSVNDFKTSLK